jgi:hypothetical protein
LQHIHNGRTSFPVLLQEGVRIQYELAALPQCFTTLR